MSTAHSFSPFSGKTHTETHWSFLRILYTVHGSSALTNTPLTCHTLPKDGGPTNNNILPQPCKLRRCFTMAGSRELSGREIVFSLALPLVDAVMHSAYHAGSWPRALLSMHAGDGLRRAVAELCFHGAQQSDGPRERISCGGPRER
jgi:hypothetical protein